MRTLGILVCGWIVGGVVLVALAGPQRGGQAIAPVRPDRLVRSSTGTIVRPSTDRIVRPPQGPQSPIAVPVLGISASDLHDTFEQPRGGGRIHRAIDIRAPKGTPVIAAVDGTIRKLFTSRAGGLTIYQFDVNEEHVYYYAHLERYADDVREGLFVKQGTVIGYVGTSGNAPIDTPHLHFSIEVLPPTKEWWKGTPVNPYPLLTTPVSALR